MINSIDDLELIEIKKIKPLCKQLDPDVLAIAMHGISPTLVKKLSESMSLIQKFKVWISPYRRKAIEIKIVEKSHQDIISKFNNLKY